MLEYYEVNPIPECCVACTEEGDCYECDHALERWHLTPESEVELKKLQLEQLRKRLKRKEQKGEQLKQ